MNDLVALLENKDPLWKDRFQQFAAIKANSWSFGSSDPGGFKAKSALLLACFHSIQDSVKGTVPVFSGEDSEFLLMFVFRIVLREEGGLECIATDEVTEHFLARFGLIPSSSIPPGEGKIKEEALKVIINLVSKLDAPKIAFVQKFHAHEPFLKWLASVPVEDESSLFLGFRCLAQISVAQENLSLLSSSGDLEVLAVCARFIQAFKVHDDSGNETLKIPAYVKDAFAASFNMLFPSSVLCRTRRPATKRELELFGQICSPMCEIFLTKGPQFNELRKAAASVIVNAPEGWENHVPKEHARIGFQFSLGSLIESIGRSPKEFQAERAMIHLTILYGLLESLPFIDLIIN